MRKWHRNRRRWALRRHIILHERLVLRMWDEVAEFEGRKSARIAVLRMRLEHAWENAA